MVVRFQHDQTYDYRVQNSPVQGWFNGVVADLYVFPPHDNPMMNVNRFREYSLLQHPNIGQFCGYEPVDGHLVFGFETSRVRIENYDFQYKDFKHTREIIRQIVQSLFFLHGKGFVHVALGQSKSYIFDQRRNSDYTWVKISVRDCHRIGSPGGGSHTKGSNMEHFAAFLSGFFCGGQSTPMQAQRRPFRYVPSSSYSPQTAYVHELRDFIRHLSTRPDVDQILNHPIFWTSERRLEFLQDTYEYCNNLVQAANNNQHPQIVAAIRGIDIRRELGQLHKSVCYDLQPDGSVPGGAYALLLGIRHFKVHRVPVLGQLGVVIHGVKFYRKFDVDIIKGVDLYFSCTVPSFFMSVYSVAKRMINVQVKPSFRKYLDLGFDSGNTEL